jgi:hypothetical protein
MQAGMNDGEKNKTCNVGVAAEAAVAAVAAVDSDGDGVHTADMCANDANDGAIACLPHAPCAQLQGRDTSNACIRQHTSQLQGRDTSNSCTDVESRTDEVTFVTQSSGLYANTASASISTVDYFSHTLSLSHSLSLSLPLSRSRRSLSFLSYTELCLV